MKPTPEDAVVSQALVVEEQSGCLNCGARMDRFFWGENGGKSTCAQCGFKHPCCDT